MKKQKSKHLGFVSFKDKSVPLGKRKQAYVTWLMQKKKYSLDDAKLACFHYFYHEEHPSKKYQL